MPEIPQHPDSTFDTLLREVAHDFGMSEAEMRQSLKIAAIVPEAIAAIVANGLADDEKALCAIADEPKERQLAAVECFATQHSTAIATQTSRLFLPTHGLI